MESPWLETRWARPFYLAFVFCLALVLLQAIKLYLRRQRLLRDLRCFPAPPTHWLYGHQKLLQDDEIEKLSEIIEKYPCAFPRWVGPFQAFLYIYDPDYAKILLSRTDPKSQFLSPWIGQGLLDLHGPKWFQHRHLLTPGFHLNILKPHAEVVVHSVNTLLDKWETMLTTQHATVEVFEHINMMTLDILLKCAFTKDTNCQINGSSDPYVKALFEFNKIIFHRTQSFLSHHDIIFNLSSEGQCFQELSQVLHHYTEKIIQDRKKSLQEERKQDNTQEKKYQDFLDVVLSAQAENEDIFSDTDLSSEVNTFILAGHDTTAAGISWLLYCLALNPEHQQRCREEIRGILGDKPSTIWDHLDEMPYTTMCIQEALRLIPPVPSISRELNKPITFPDGCVLPAGMDVILSIWGLHHNPAIWENPKVFNPLRFSPENSDQRHPYAFLPFSAGPRDCIGQKFAMIQLKVSTALILLRFEVTPDPTRPPILSPQIVLRSKNGIHLFVKKIP
ncbi:cytochrome P450 4X1 [Tenrec ecaudatus]|uniref:cytochrome P450 4X1 n=1 Tax=Tenrec ecaudatus TaxID=94439 RepID=UPI003F593A7F